MRRSQNWIGGLLLSLATSAVALEVGDAVPAVDGEVLDSAGRAVDLGAELAQGHTLVYFFPKASTPG